jgi:hypothetical protein
MTKQPEQRVLLGFEIGTGDRVDIPLAHMVVTGLTQASGKTTTLKALISRTTDRRSVAFITKRAEGAFQDASLIAPYFREQSDWQFVESLLEATMRQRMKFERGWIMRVTRGAQTLEQVYANLQVQLFGDDNYRSGNQKKRKHAVHPASGMNADIYLQLSAYFDILLPQLRGLRLRMGAGAGNTLILKPGLNVMDLTEFSMEMQSLIIASTIDACYLMNGVTVVIPEAWEFLPQSRKTPVMRSAEAFVRKAAASQNFLWLDSQDISGIEKTILKQVSVWILGNQREINEVEHTLKQLPIARHARPKPEEIMHLGRGEFFACFDKETHKVYVCPQWLASGVAQRYAVPHSAIESVQLAEEIAEHFAVYENATHEVEELRTNGSAREVLKKIKEEDRNVDYKEAYEKLLTKVAELEKRLSRYETAPAEPLQPSRFTSDAPRPDPVTLAVDVNKPEIEVTVKRHTIRMSDANSDGRLALLISQGFFDTPKKVEHLNIEFRARGWFAQMGRPAPLGPAMSKLAEMGFVRVVGVGTYQSIEGMKVRIKDEEVAA